MATCTSCNTETFRYRVVNGGDYCYDCAGTGHVPHNVFPMTLDHLAPGGKKVVADNVRHLRRLERQYGVQSVIFNETERGANHAPQTDFRRITPWFHGGERMFR